MIDRWAGRGTTQKEERAAAGGLARGGTTMEQVRKPAISVAVPG